MNLTITDFLLAVQGDVRDIAQEENAEKFLEESFVEYTSAILEGTSASEDITPVSFQERGMAVSGYSYFPDTQRLDLVIADYQPSSEIRSLGKTEVDNLLKRVVNFVVKCQAGLWKNLEPAHEVTDLAKLIFDNYQDLDELRVFLVTNGRIKKFDPLPKTIDRLRVKTEIWDIERLYKLDSSGKPQEQISVDFRKLGLEPIQCLGPMRGGSSYEAFLAVIPGNTLATIYSEFGPRLLELNVRSFLQARGKVNKGLQETIKNEPEKFLAYNNGVSMTASKVVVSAGLNGAKVIERIDDLQIVNGGQTTASLNFAATRGKLDLSRVMVQAKISVVEETELGDLVPKISQFANSQNTIKMADFSANDPFHVSLERLSRTIWAPGVDGSHIMTRWFYERARGQYADALAAERTPAKQREFKQIHPVSQKFTKTDLAKFVMLEKLRPHLVCLGAEKNFREFTMLMQEQEITSPDEIFFKEAVAQGIIVRNAEKIVAGQKMGGYRAQIVAHSISLLYGRLDGKVDFSKIWNDQKLSDSYVMAIDEISQNVRDRLVSSAGSRNISEWAKKEQCWEAMQQIKWEPSMDLKSELRQA